MAYDFSTLKKSIKETEEWLQHELASVRTGRATPILLDGVKVTAYGALSPLNQVANIGVEDARTLRVAPWDSSLIKDVEKAITDANLGVGVGADDQGVRVSFPELTAERRTQLARIAGERTEQAKTTLRGHRTDAIKEIDQLKKEGMSEDQARRDKEELQKLIDAGNESLAEVLKKKETEIAM